MRFGNNFFAYLATIFIAFSLVILPMKNALANEESDKHNAQGRTYYRNSDYQHAIEEYTKAIKIDEKNPAYHNNRGWAYCDSKDYANAEKDFSEAIRLDPNYAYAYRGLARVYRDSNQSRNEDAISNFIEAGKISCAPGNFHSYEYAITVLNEALALNDDNAEAHNLRGQAYFNLEKYDEALKDFNKVIQLDSNYTDAYRGLGFVYWKQDKRDRFIKGI